MSKEMLNALDALEAEKAYQKRLSLKRWKRHWFLPTNATTVKRKM